MIFVYCTARINFEFRRYEDLLVSLLQEVIKKLQTKVDDDDEDEEDIFECAEVLQNLYLNNHANVIDSLAELIPQKAFAYVVSFNRICVSLLLNECMSCM